ncbi:MAG TPA: hypothetical protein DDY71_11320 [Spirochaetia bacterium]|nr:hypothetical protein [Spirochaetia bacterium]HBI38223.1 hypothetical protein [Spirochaetia bacterium]
MRSITLFDIHTINSGSILTFSIIVLLAFFSIISISIIIERFIFLNRFTININRYKSMFPDKIIDLKITISEKNKKTPFETIILSIIKSSVINRSEMRERLDAQFTEIYLIYHKRINLLGIFAKLSTLIGLFGTVTGMISSFNSIVEKGISTASIVASGISQALITTAAGLIIAIPATFFYEYFNDRIDGEIRKMEIICSELISTLIDKSKNWGALK